MHTKDISRQSITRLHLRVRSGLDRLRSLDPCRRSGLDPQAGAVLVEFALILPLFMLMVFLVFDFGRAINYWIDETHLASEGARLAAVDRVPNGGDLKTYLRGEADTQELRDGGTRSVPDALKVCIDFPVDADGTSAEVGDPVKVTVSTTYNWVPIINLPVANTTLVGSATHRLEREPSYTAGCTS